MIDYKTMYAVMFNAATDAIEILSAQYQTEALQQVISILQTAQLKCEELYITGTDDESDL